MWEVGITEWFGWLRFGFAHLGAHKLVVSIYEHIMGRDRLEYGRSKERGRERKREKTLTCL